MTLLYLAGLLVGLAGMIVLDLRFHLFFGRAPLRAAIVMVVGIAFFLAWDVTGIGVGVFFPGDATIVTGVLLAPGLPLEEVFFLALLCYTAMNAYGLVTRWSSSGRRPRVETTTPPSDGLDTPAAPATRPPVSRWSSSGRRPRVETTTPRGGGLDTAAERPTRPAERPEAP